MSNPPGKEEFADVSLNCNPWTVDFCYDCFNAVTPEWPKNKDDVWKKSDVFFKTVGGQIEARLTRSPTVRLIRFLTSQGDTDTSKLEIRFAVKARSKSLNYICYDNHAGVKLVRIEKIRQPSELPGAAFGSRFDWSKTMEYSRVFTTDEAVQHCGAVKELNGYVGKKALHAIQLENAKTRTETYHEGECRYDLVFL